ncbi:MAG: hypothetical protein ACREUF_03335 [Solimonas sp.]
MPAAPAQDVEALQRQAEALQAKSAALTESYRRWTWVRFVLVFFPIPFVVVLVRLQLEPWHYYLAGGAYLIFAALLYVIDGKASAKCDVAAEEAENAQQAYDAALKAAPASSSAPSPGRPGPHSLRASR